MADKRTRIDDLIRLGELRAAGSAPYSKRIRDAAAQFLEESGNNPGYFGESPAQTSNRAGRRAAKFRQQDILERDIKRGETTGLGDLLTFLPALSAGKAALAGNKLGAGVNALAFTSQFDDSKLGQAVGDLTAAYPMFGMRNIGGALKSAKRAAELGKQPPIFNMAEGRIAPNRMKLIEKGLREHIAMSGTKDVPGQLRKLDEWIERNPFWGKYPLHKRELFDTFPQDISGSLDQTLKDLGYGGITQAPRDLSLLVDKRVNRPGIPDRSSTLTRTWEEKKPFEQKALAGEPSGILKGWMERNPGKTPPIFTRPGEQTPAGWRNLLDLDTKARGAGQSIDPATKAFLEQMAIGSGIGTAANLATGGVAVGDDNLAVVPSWKKLIRKDSLDAAANKLANRRRVEFMPPSIYQRSKPDLTKMPATDNYVSLLTNDNHYFSYPKKGMYELLIDGWPKSGISVERPRQNWFSDTPSTTLKVDAARRSAGPEAVKFFQNLDEYYKTIENYRKASNASLKSALSLGGGREGPSYPHPPYRTAEYPSYPQGQALSPRDISTASRILGAQFPEFDKVGGFRVSGIRKGPAGMAREKSGMETSVPLRKPSSEENRIKTLADSRRWLHELISNRGSKPAAMTVGGATTKNPTADYQKIFDYLGDPEDFFRKSRGNLGALGIGAAGAGAAALDSLVSGENQQEGGDNRAGLVVNSRNLARLARLQEAAHARLEKIRPAFPEMNYLESVFAAKYPKIYEKAAGASPKGTFNPSLTGISSGSFSPFTSRIAVGMPDSAAGWNKPSTIPNIFNTMGHEALHGVDFQRLGSVNHPWTGRRLDLGDFISPIITASPREMRDLADNLKRFYPNAYTMVRNIKPKYTLPSYGDEGFFTRLKKDIGYLLNPIELRARKAGKTSSKTLSNLMDRLTSFEE